MTHPAACSPSSLVANAPSDAAYAHDDERLPVPLAALIVVSLSVALWGGVAFLLRWALG